MSVKDQNYLRTLQEFVTIYRGMTLKEYDSGDYGLSWSLKQNVAIFYRDVYIRNFDTRNDEKIIKTLVVPKSEIKAYFSDREEYEVIYLGTNSKKEKQ